MTSEEDTASKEEPPTTADKVFTSTFYKQLDMTRNMEEGRFVAKSEFMLHQSSISSL